MLIDKWKCQICGEERPDDKISVHSKPIVINGLVLGQTNVRYCNDRQDCKNKALDLDYFIWPILEIWMEGLSHWPILEKDKKEA
jgi:hypothetical protein